MCLIQYKLYLKKYSLITNFKRQGVDIILLKVTEMLVNVLNICSDDELMEPTDPESIGDLMPHQPTEEQILEFRKKEERRIALQKKILAVAKMAKYFHTLREESETGLYFMSYTCTYIYFSFTTQGFNTKWNAAEWYIGRASASSRSSSKSDMFDQKF